MATPSDFNITYFQNLTVDQFCNTSPAEAPPVKEIQQKIDRLRSELDELGGTDALEAALQSAKEDLQEIEIQHEIGEATDAELSEAEAAVTEAQEDLETARRKSRALDRLTDRKAAALEAAQRAIRARGITLYEKVMEKAFGPLKEGYETVEKARDVLRTCGRNRDVVMQSTDADLLLFHNPDTLSEILEDHLTDKG
jgi:chromosome segregation ATPase